MTTLMTRHFLLCRCQSEDISFAKGVIGTVASTSPKLSWDQQKFDGPVRAPVAVVFLLE